MLLKNKNAIIIIAFNDARLIEHQIKCIDKYCTDRGSTDIIVIDNSSSPECSTAIRDVCCTYAGQVNYRKITGVYYNPSESHSNACNFAYMAYRLLYHNLMFLDHDCFPVKNFSLKGLLCNNVMAGVSQVKSKKYLWPGCVVFDVLSLEGWFLIPNFDISHELGLDSGGMLYKIIEFYGDRRIGYFDEIPHQNTIFDDATYPNYNVIANGTFMHFINASGWNKNENNAERLNSLYKILESKL